MLNSGDILDKKYVVIKILGKGGMGTVYLCENIIQGNFWAIKEVIKNTKNIDILTEANILKNLSHPGIRRIVDIFYENNNLYMVQDYVEGQTLKEYVKVNGRIQTEKTCRITSDLCDIIGYLHNQNPAIIYRDIKPSNIIITTSEKVVLIDFGISKIYKGDKSQDTVCAGSNGYAAPEQYGLGKCCTQTDIYGIGMLVYFMVKGKTPFTGIEPLLNENYGPDINEKLKIIIQKCVKIDIKDRYISVKDLKKEILEVLKKDKYEKIAGLSDYNISTNVGTKKAKTKITNKGKLTKIKNGFFCCLVVTLASIYIFHGNKKESTVMNTIDRTEIVSPVVGSSSIEKDAIKEAIKKSVKTPIISPVKVATSYITQDSSIKEKTPQLSKAKDKEKRKNKQTNIVKKIK
ncbi:serine/threonine protein kinase [Clostridium sp. CM028]|uniref:serine/threonine-protein kinase n=1 Tax=Clostridium sp. CM028 TaxID=2851575 RepID=UPI001C6E43B4|nr:serine/threonine-protein kinase [Clostridium sp. CM028]MBW9148755.1 serine/threonine protein kinase [Clostridium sp. CM028]WLC63139.1 serine/threonine protein kinase [Clostridium sp. CM028]